VTVAIVVPSGCLTVSYLLCYYLYTVRLGVMYYLRYYLYDTTLVCTPVTMVGMLGLMAGVPVVGAPRCFAGVVSKIPYSDVIYVGFSVVFDAPPTMFV
jgi:hypothetical protein